MSGQICFLRTGCVSLPVSVALDYLWQQPEYIRWWVYIRLNNSVLLE